MKDCHPKLADIPEKFPLIYGGGNSATTLRESVSYDSIHPAEETAVVNNGEPPPPPQEQQRIDGSMGATILSMGEVVADVAGTVAGAVVEAVVEVKDVAVEVVAELKETAEEVIVMEEVAVEDEAFYLLEMNLVRETSVLPQDIIQVATTHYVVEADPEHGQPKPEEHRYIPTRAPVTAYLTLAVAVFGVSALGPFLALQQGVDATLKIFWRKSCAALFLLPFAIRSIYRAGQLPHISMPHFINLLLAAGSYASMCVFFAWSLDYTTVGNAVILSNAQAILLLIGKAIMGDVITLAEGSGALIAFSGAVFCSRDSADLASETENKDTTLLGDAYALLSAVAGVAYLVTAKAVRPYIDLYVFMFLIMTIGSMYSLLYAYVAKLDFSWDFDINRGVFGWLHWEFRRLPVEILMMLCSSILGAMGYVQCMHYFSNVVISVAALAEPVVAELTALAIGVGALPGWKGWLGNALVLAGTFTVVYRPHSAGQKEAGGSH